MKLSEEELYQIEKESHYTFIRGYRACINDANRALESDELLTASQLLKRLNSELSKRESMDAPNKPGYFRANNDQTNQEMKLNNLETAITFIKSKSYYQAAIADEEVVKHHAQNMVDYCASLTAPSDAEVSGDEISVDTFLRSKIGFYQSAHPVNSNIDYEDIETWLTDFSDLRTAKVKEELEEKEKKIESCLSSLAEFESLNYDINSELFEVRNKIAEKDREIERLKAISNTPQFSCIICDAVFRDEYSLGSHMQFNH